MRAINGDFVDHKFCFILHSKLMLYLIQQFTQFSSGDPEKGKPAWLLVVPTTVSHYVLGIILTLPQNQSSIMKGKQTFAMIGHQALMQESEQTDAH